MENKAPIIDNRYVCIVNLKEKELAAVLASYFPSTEGYPPIFLFPEVSTPSTENYSSEDDDFLSQILASRAKALINNAIARMKGCQYLILGGFDKNQKSYIPSEWSNIIEIDTISDIPKKLFGLKLPQREILLCKPEQILIGLFIARKNNKVLAIGKDAAHLPEIADSEGGIVIVEDKEDATPVLAVNYALSVNANLRVVPPLKDQEENEIAHHLKEWRGWKDDDEYQKIAMAVNCRIGQLQFKKFSYATFFTDGLPYSLIIENVVPCSYVDLSRRPDLFVYNAILFEYVPKFHSAVIFSPRFFSQQQLTEETDALIDLLRDKKFYIRPLLGRKATVFNLDFHAQHFPYDILHLCSHGGEISGVTIWEEFIDRKGAKHTIEYDAIHGFASMPGKELIAEHRKTIFKKIDGFEWMSEELKNKNYPHYVFQDMFKSMQKNTKTMNYLKVERKDNIPTSCAIRCTDSVHQGMFHILASHSSPFVFNNTCWSWPEVASFFLECGARGYVGTLWDIENSEAVLGAETFYKNVFHSTIISAFHNAVLALKGTRSENIYVFWGLHFSTLEPGESYKNSKARVFRELVRSFFSWTRKVHSMGMQTVKENSAEIAEYLYREIFSNFTEEDFEKMEEGMKKKITHASEKNRSFRNTGVIEP